MTLGFFGGSRAQKQISDSSPMSRELSNATLFSGMKVQ
jgi:hypothetical protein